MIVKDLVSLDDQIKAIQARADRDQSLKKEEDLKFKLEIEVTERKERELTYELE